MMMTDSIRELESILKIHVARYPLMQPTDAVKLIYQNEFGGGHMIADEQSCMKYLHREYESVEKDVQQTLAEDIGNGIVRVRLCALQNEDVDALGAAFIRSANAHKGNLDRCLKKLEVLRRVTAQGAFAFGVKELEEYLLPYAAAGYPPVSHSDAFRSAYHPAYRIVLKDLLPDALRNK